MTPFFLIRLWKVSSYILGISVHENVTKVLCGLGKSHMSEAKGNTYRVFNLFVTFALECNQQKDVF